MKEQLWREILSGKTSWAINQRRPDGATFAGILETLLALESDGLIRLHEPHVGSYRGRRVENRIDLAGLQLAFFKAGREKCLIVPLPWFDLLDKEGAFDRLGVGERFEPSASLKEDLAQQRAEILKDIATSKYSLVPFPETP